VFAQFQWEKRTSRITNPDGTVVFEMTDAEIPADWSQLATDIMVSKYFRKAGVPQVDPATGSVKRDEQGNVVTGPEKSARQVIHRLAGCWTHWGKTHSYFDSADDAQAFYDELCFMMLNQMCAPNSPQWFNTGLHFAYGITGPAQGHFYCDPATGEVKKSTSAYERPQPHACFIQAVSDDLVNEGGIMDLWTREARLFKYGSGTGSNFSRLRGENEPLSGGGKSSGLMSFLKIGDRAAGAIKSGGTTRRAAKMVCLDLDHPDIEMFVNWKVREELKVAALVEGLKALPEDQRDLAKKLKLKLDYDFNGEAYYTVSGQNSNNSVRIPNSFFKALEKDGDWKLTWRTNGKVCKTLKARDLWDQISFAAWRCADPGVQFDDTINQWHTCPKSGRINASNPCVTGDTRVLTPGGIWRRIDQMIHLPSRVVTNLNGQAIHATEGAFPTGHKEVFELRTAGGYCLKLTADHKVWTRTRGWVEAAQLTTTDEVRLPARPAAVQEVGEPQDPRLFQLAGLMLSRHNDVPDAIELDRVLEGEPTLVEQFADYAERVFGDDQTSSAAVGGTITTTLTHRRLIDRCRGLVRYDRGQRRLTDDAFTAGLAAQKHLLRALFTADATIEHGEVVLHTDSIGLAQDVQLILLGFGVKSRVAPGSLALASLVVDCGSFRHFARHVCMLPGRKLEQLANACSFVESLETDAHYDAVASFSSLGVQPVYDLTEPVTSSFVANGITVHNCSEYMFLDDTACNLASLNVLKFYDAETRTFDVNRYRHGIKLWTIVLEISVLMASFPSEEIARLSYRYRTLGLGYANLGAMLMQAGIPYDSEKGRAICGALTSVLTGESYATSAEMARELGAFPGYDDNKPDMLRVIRNHRRAAYAAAPADYEALDIRPVPIDAAQFSGRDSIANGELLNAARECWDRALAYGEKHGYRNAQTTVIAPTGTIGLLMDCDTTGVEPDFALVKFKKLAGGGYFKIANQSLTPALRTLGYSAEQAGDILKYVMGTLSLHGAPVVNYDSLRAKGFTQDELDKIEAGLPGTFELPFAFSPWSLGGEVMQRLGVSESEWQAPGFNLLRKLGFKKRDIEAASVHICGRGTVEGAPHLRTDHYPVFDCANKCGKLGTRYIAPEGHIRMMAAAQPFISGAISKTINLPNEAGIDDIKRAYDLSWRLGLKANALYRDGSKLSQPLNVKSDSDIDDEESDENVEAAKADVVADVAKAAALAEVAVNGASGASGANGTDKADANVEIAPDHTRVIEKIVERVVERPLRRRLPDTRNAITHKFDVAGHEGYITVGLYEDGAPGEVFITMAKEGSTIGGLMDCIATLVSVSLQYGVPVSSLVRKFEHVRFEPNGMTRNQDIPMAKSIVDYIFRWLAMEFVPGYRELNAPPRKPAAAPKGSPSAAAASQKPAPAPAAPKADAAPVARIADAPAKNGNGNGNGHAVTADSSPDAKPFDYGSGLANAVESAAASATQQAAPKVAGRLSGAIDPLSQQGSSMQADAPACDVCGSITVRSGTCYKCQNCGNSMGCS
jgi:ribonucleoside-diphosphate reductase alpha chain